MKYLYYLYDGEVEIIVGHEGCYDDNYGRCKTCGTEGELVTEDKDKIQGMVFVAIQLIQSRHEQ